jgi:hypothetical protein
MGTYLNTLCSDSRCKTKYLKTKMKIYKRYDSTWDVSLEEDGKSEIDREEDKVRV